MANATAGIDRIVREVIFILRSIQNCLRTGSVWSCGMAADYSVGRVIHKRMYSRMAKPPVTSVNKKVSTRIRLGVRLK